MRTVKELKELEGDLLENALKELSEEHNHIVLWWNGYCWHCVVDGPYVESGYALPAVLGHFYAAEDKNET